MKRCPSTRSGPRRKRSSPNKRMPVPASKITNVWESDTSTQAVFPPYFVVVGPGAEIDPRVPQNLIFIVLIIVHDRRFVKALKNSKHAPPRRREIALREMGASSRPKERRGFI